MRIAVGYLYRKQRRMKKRSTNPFINAVRERYMEELNLHHLSPRSLRRWAANRNRSAVEARAAVFNAVSPFVGRAEAAAMFWKDHSTILHAIKNHDMYMAYSSKYGECYEKATRVVVECSKEMNVYPIGQYRHYISNEAELDVLQKTLDNIQKTIDHVKDRVQKNQGPLRDYRKVSDREEQ